MTDERRTVEDDARLADLLRSYADTGLRPYDPSSIAAHAIGAGNARRHERLWWLPLAPAHGRQVSLLVALALLLIVAAVMALVGAADRLEQRTVTPDRVSPSPSAEQTIVAGSIAVWVGAEGGDEIRILDPDGTGQTAFPSTGHDSYPVYSPDGTRIAYTSHDNRGPVRVVNADGTGVRVITEGYSAPEPVTWSPDGRQIAFWGFPLAGDGDSPGLYVVNVDGSDVRRLVGQDAIQIRLAWSPDGTLIAGVGPGPGDEPVLRVVDPVTGSVTRVSDAPLLGDGDWAAPSWSPDSARLLYAVAAPGVATASGIAAAERGTSGWTERLVSAPTPSGDVSPLWVDADRFVFVRGGERLVLAHADGSSERELVRAEFVSHATPCVAPDGSRVAVALEQDDGTELLVVPIDGATPPQRIEVGDVGPHGPACSWQAVKR